MTFEKRVATLVEDQMIREEVVLSFEKLYFSVLQ